MNWHAAFGFHSDDTIEATGKSFHQGSFELEHPLVFVERFWKWRDSLFMVACRVLGDAHAATLVVEKSFRKACPKPPKFASDGAFGSWLLRILLDEAFLELATGKRAGKLKRQQFFPRMPQAVPAKLEFMDEFWCLDTTT